MHHYPIPPDLPLGKKPKQQPPPHLTGSSPHVLRDTILHDTTLKNGDTYTLNPTVVTNEDENIPNLIHLGRLQKPITCLLIQ
jgi:hypothetical protein